MPAPTIVAVSPNPNATDVVLGTMIVVTFDQLMDTTTIDSSTFSLTGPGQTQFISPTELNTRNPQAAVGREYVNGTFTFATNESGCTVLTFVPQVPLRPNVLYKVLIVGAGNVPVTGTVVSNLEDPPVQLNGTNQWTFTTGDINLVVPPVTSPLPLLTYPLDPSTIQIQQQVFSVGNDLSQTINIIFPGQIDPTTVCVEQILLSLEPLLNDPSVIVPSNLQPEVIIKGNVISITIYGWPNS